MNPLTIPVNYLRNILLKNDNEFILDGVFLNYALVSIMLAITSIILFKKIRYKLIDAL